MVCFPPGQPVDETMYFAVEQLKCYFVSWRGEVIDALDKQLAKDRAGEGPKTEQQKCERELQIYEHMSPVQKKQISNMDEALLKCFLLDPHGCQASDITQLFKTVNLFLESESSLQLLQKSHPTAMVNHLKLKKKHRQALDLILQNGQPGDPETTKQLANYLLDIGLGIRGSEQPDALRSIHKEYTAKVYAMQPDVMLEMYAQRCSKGVNQLDVTIALDVCQSADAEYKCRLIESALETRSYYEDTLEQVQLELAKLYVELCQRTSQQIIAQVASQTLTLPQKVKFFGQFFPADLLLFRLNLTED